MMQNFKRIFKFAINDFFRNKGISLAAIFVLTVTIMCVTGLLFFRGMSDYLVSQIKDKIDITAYFKESASEADILNIKNQISGMAGIKKVEYVSKDDAVLIFADKHKDNAVFTEALNEVGSNPFLPSLNIVTSGDISQYEQVSNVLQSSSFSNIVEKVDFYEKKDTIEKVYSITSNINTFGLILGIILVIVAILVVFNTIKLAVDSSKEEISTMRIVGASDWFVRGPFIIQGIIYGFIAFIICIIVSAIFVFFISSKISVMMPGFSLIRYFTSNLWFLIMVQLGFGVAVGVVSSFVVVKKYLDI